MPYHDAIAAVAQRGPWVAVTLALSAGYVDTVGFVALFGLFTAHVTGNFVLIGSELARPTQGVWLKLLAFPAFIAAVALARVVVIHTERTSKDPAPRLLTLQVVLLCGFMVAGLFAMPIENPNSLSALLTGMLGAAAMGIQNAAGRLIWSTQSPTTVMTGNVTVLVIDLVDALRGEANEEMRTRINRFLWPVLSFAFGAILAGLAFQWLSFLALLLPIALVSALLPESLRPSETHHVNL